MDISATAGDFIYPKITARLIRLAVKEVYILLPHHVGREVDRVGDIAVRDKDITQLQISDCFTQMTFHSREISLGCGLVRLGRCGKRPLKCNFDPCGRWVNASVIVENRVSLLDLRDKLLDSCRS